MKNGFTLMELLAVIIILSALVLVISIFVNPVIDTAKEGLSDIQIKHIEEAAKAYYIKEDSESMSYNLDEIRSCVTVEELIELGYLDKDEIIDPEKEEKIVGSVNITYRANNYSYKYQDNACSNYDKGIICEAVKTTDEGNVPKGNFEPGDAYNCKVDPNKEPYKFYVLSTNDDDTINLIMDRNINSDGTPTTKGIRKSEKNNNGGIYNLVAWINQEDYEGAGGKEWGNFIDENLFGPITVIKFLQEATKDWTNVIKMKIDTFKYGLYNELSPIKTYEIYARMPYNSEVVNASLNEMWLVDYLTGEYDEEEGIVGRKNGIDGIIWYWTFEPSNDDYAFALAVYYYGNTGYFGVYDEDLIGVRPVITIYNSQIE